MPAATFRQPCGRQRCRIRAELPIWRRPRQRLGSSQHPAGSCVQEQHANTTILLGAYLAASWIRKPTPRLSQFQLTCAAMCCREPWCQRSKGDSPVGHCPSDCRITGSGRYCSRPGWCVLPCAVPQKSVPGTLSSLALPLASLTDQAMWAKVKLLWPSVCVTCPGLPQAADLQSCSISSPQ